MRKSSTDSKVSEERRVGAPGARAEIALQAPVKLAAPPQPPEDSTPEQVDMPYRKLQPTESPHQSRLLAGAVALGREAYTEAGFLAGPVTAWGTYAGTVHS